MDCPGCFDCGEWIDKETLIEFCSECIRNRDGNITEDDCIGLCPHYDNGLLEVMAHYGLSLDVLKRESGY
ncbi:MAG: hypothetical protein GF353_13360 [Candidatus Lokiarchaeota archaeon]|nr:hypothetical protein [Candidatus Lokiarchaeota archaeon]